MGDKMILSKSEYTGPDLDMDAVRRFESRYGISLPRSYIDLLSVVNGGTFVSTVEINCDDYIVEAEGIKGVGGSWGIDSEELGSEYLIQEWGYPDIGIVIGIMISGGSDAIMLNYNSPSEPSVSYVSDDGEVYELARTFDKFQERIRSR